jgi:hypothetical protein
VDEIANAVQRDVEYLYHVAGRVRVGHIQSPVR